MCENHSAIFFNRVELTEYHSSGFAASRTRDSHMGHVAEGRDCSIASAFEDMFDYMVSFDTFSNVCFERLFDFCFFARLSSSLFECLFYSFSHSLILILSFFECMF